MPNPKMKDNIFLFFLLVLIPLLSIFNSLLTVISLLVLIMFSFNNDRYLIILLLIVSSYNGLLQYQEESVFRLLVEPFLFVVVFFRCLILFFLNKVLIRKTSLNYAIGLFVIYVFFVILIGSFDKDFSFFLLSLKDYFFPLSIFFYFVICFSTIIKDEHEYSYFMKCMILGIFIIALMSLLNYFFSISGYYNRYVIPDGLHNEDFAVSRSLGVISITRMQSVFGLSTQGAASCLYATSLGMLIFGNKLLKFRKIELIFVFSIILFSGVLSGAFTFYTTIFLFLLSKLFYIKNKSKYWGILMMPILFLVMIIIFTMKVEVNNGSEKIDIISYAFSGFIKPALDNIDNLNWYEFIFGIGLYPKLVYNQISDIAVKTELFRYIYDNWLFGCFYQTGIIGFFIFITIIAIVLSNYKKYKGIYQLSACAFISFLAFSHGTFMIDKLFIIKSVFILSMLSCGVSNGKINNYSYNLQK